MASPAGTGVSGGFELGVLKFSRGRGSEMRSQASG